MNGWIGLALVLATVMVTLLLTVPIACRRCGGAGEGEDGDDD